jgi:hypothetical protein
MYAASIRRNESPDSRRTRTTALGRERSFVRAVGDSIRVRSWAPGEDRLAWLQSVGPFPWLGYSALEPTATSSLPASSGEPVAPGRVDASVFGEARKRGHPVRAMSDDCMACRVSPAGLGGHPERAGRVGEIAGHEKPERGETEHHRESAASSPGISSLISGLD